MSSQQLTSITNSGKPIVFLPKLAKEESDLKRAARNGNYYATLALKQLRELSTGAIHNSNVYIPNINNSKANTFQMFSLYVPGARLDLERRSNDTYVVVDAQLAEGFSSQGGAEFKPGIYECTEEDGKTRAKYRNNKLIKAKDERTVVICGTEFRSPDEAATKVAEQLEKIRDRSAKLRGEFDIYFTPQDSAPDGMKHFKPEKNTQASMHSSILTNAMDVARKHKGVFWGSLSSGSAILSQSIETLHRRSVSFKEAKHDLRFVSPTTDPRLAIGLAGKMGMTFDAKNVVFKGSVKVRIANALSSRKRALDKSDPYTLKHYGGDVAQGAMVTVGAVGVGLFAAGLFPAASSSVLLAGTVVSGIGGLQTVHGLCKKFRNK